MPIPPRYLEILLHHPEPGEAYRRCLQLLSEDTNPPQDLTREIVYGCEVRYALEVLEAGRPQRLYNFGDLDGKGNALLWSVLGRRRFERVAFLGAGPYPVTAFLVKERYPHLSVVCYDNDLTGYLLGQAVCRRFDASIEIRYGDAHQQELSGFDVIIVAAMVNGRTELVRRLLEETGAEIIVRGEMDLRHPRLHAVASTFDEEGRILA